MLIRNIYLTLLALVSVSCGEPSNSDFKKEMTELPENHEFITLGAGCFWCVEVVFQQLDGVHSAISGYMGGHLKNPTYEDISRKDSGHIEVVQVAFDPKMITSEEILAWFWKAHDPTTLNRQGNDIGPQYASAIFYHSDEQKEISEASVKTHQEDFKDPIVTVIRKAEKFYPAEDYHQNYYQLNKSKNPYCRVVITPKLKKLKLEH